MQSIIPILPLICDYINLPFELAKINKQSNRTIKKIAITFSLTMNPNDDILLAHKLLKRKTYTQRFEINSELFLKYKIKKLIIDPEYFKMTLSDLNFLIMKNTLEELRHSTILDSLCNSTMMQLTKLIKIEVNTFNIEIGSYLPNLEYLKILENMHGHPANSNIMSKLKVFQFTRRYFYIYGDMFRIMPNITILHAYCGTFNLDEFKTLKHIKEYSYSERSTTLTDDMKKYCSDNKIIINRL